MVHSMSTSPIATTAKKSSPEGKSLIGLQWRVRALKAQDVEAVPGYSGGAIMIDQPETQWSGAAR